MIADVWCPWCRDHQRAELTADRDAQRTRADAAEAEVARLRAIVEGRTKAPTDDEVAAHAAAGGRWRWIVRRPDGGVFESLSGESEWPPSDPLEGVTARIVAGASVTWWTLDAQRRPCAWPVVP